MRDLYNSILHVIELTTGGEVSAIRIADSERTERV